MTEPTTHRSWCDRADHDLIVREGLDNGDGCISQIVSVDLHGSVRTANGYVAAPDPDGDPTVVLCVVPATGVHLSAADVEAYARMLLALVATATGQDVGSVEVDARADVAVLAADVRGVLDAYDLANSGAPGPRSSAAGGA